MCLARLRLAVHLIFALAKEAAEIRMQGGGGGEQKLKGAAERGAGSSGGLLLGSVEFYRPAEESLQRVRFKAPWKAGQRKAVKADKESRKSGERKGETEGK